MSSLTYDDFLAAKVAIKATTGLPCEPSEVNPICTGHVRDIAAWAVRGGNRGIFTSFGLHKSLIQLEVLRLTLEKSGGAYGLLALPLGVRPEFLADLDALATGDRDWVTDEQRAQLRAWLGDGRGRIPNLRFIKDTKHVDEPGIYLTNYESIREEKIDPTIFTVSSLDEASILRSFGSKTFSAMLFGPMQEVEYRHVATATPSPNDYIELLAYSHYLGIMDIGEAKTRFFQRNSQKADDLTILPHKEEEFWLWCASWAIFLQKPSELGYSDVGYELPELDIHWHELPTDHTDAKPNKRGQGLLVKDSSLDITEASKEKRSSLAIRIAHAAKLDAEDPDQHKIFWHHLEDERRALEKEIPNLVTVFGDQKSIEERETVTIGFSDGKIPKLGGKPSMLGSGCNFQRHCHRSIYVGIDAKFNDFIQSVYRIQRCGQKHRVRLDLIYTEAERSQRENLERKWKQDTLLRARMSAIIKKYGLSSEALATTLQSTLGVERQVAMGENWLLANYDTVKEAPFVESNSLGLILTSPPFSNQYRYTPSYNDFGHTDGLDHFLEQMDYLTPELFRTLIPGRVLALHIKDRIVPGEMIGQSYQTVEPFHAYLLLHFKKHGFTYGGMKTIVTDVVRENNQTYRLGWSEVCKDASRMSCGMPEYLMIFRKPPSDSSVGYADIKVEKTKDEYTRARWQFDAHGFMRSSGNRLLMPEDLQGLRMKAIWRAFKKHSMESVYDFDHDVSIAEYVDSMGMLPPDFMLLQPQSWHDDVWTNVMRAQTLNVNQSAKSREKHLCPLPFDIVDRAIFEWSNPGDVVYDPFSGLGTVPIRAVKAGRYGRGVELNPRYWEDSCFHARQQENKVQNLSLFDLLEEPAAEVLEAAS